MTGASTDHRPMDEPGAVDALASLAQAMRLRIFRTLVGAGPQGLTPGALAATLAVPGTTLSFHLKELMHAGMVSQQREGRRLLYRPSLDRMTALLDYLSAHCCQTSGNGRCDIETTTRGMAALPAVKHEPLPSNRSPDMNDTTEKPPAKVYGVLFVCTHNSARSIMAEGLLNSLGQGRFKAWSAGSHPRGEVNPLALQTLASMRIPTKGFRSKDWAEFAAPGAPALDFVFTVCDKAAGEVCPVWPGQPMTAHWGVPDPASAEGTDEEKSRVFWDTAVTLKRRIELMLALPIASLDRMAVQREIAAIGTR